MRVNQFHSGTAVGDAITNQMLLIQRILQRNGYESDIFAEFIVPELKDMIRPIKDYKDSADNILIIHHSMGIGVFDYVTSFKDKKIVIYHNITPEKFFEDEHTKKWIRIGLRQMQEYGKLADYFIAASNYNRKQMIEMGIPDEIDVLPVHVSLDRFDKVSSNQDIINKYKDMVNILFVGRVVWNKCQSDVIKAFAVYNKYFNKKSNLFIVGDDGNSYAQELSVMAEQLGIKDHVFITGKVDEESLKAYYEVSKLFLCMSEHEGFGVPLLEAMKLGKPVIAYRSSAIPETMGKAGILVTEKKHELIGTLINEVIEDKDLYNKIVDDQKLRIKKLQNTDTETILLKAIKQLKDKSRKRTIQMQGPFETSYSLAIVNRKLIEAIDDIGKDDVSIYCTEGSGDYLPKSEDLKDKPHAKKLWEKSKECEYPDVTIRNMYPPRVNDVVGGLNFQSFGWEESVIPESYIKDFNTYLDGIGTTSDYVTEKLIECGITIPVKTMGNGVELVENYDDLKPFHAKSKKSIKFLHISSAFPRKGVDVLLKGFYEAFTGDDDVCLILKTFPNIHNKVGDMLANLNKHYENPPEVEWLDYDMPKEDLCSLYKSSDCYVSVARGEGFGLPVAEAMLAKVPVIVCANSGMADFCNESTALLVDYELVPAQSHVQVDGNQKVSFWAEPNQKTLISQFKYFIENKGSKEIASKVSNAYNLISTNFTWNKVAERWLDFIDEVASNQFHPKVAMVTTWNSKCGIAEYSKMEVLASRHNVDYEIYPNYGVELTSHDEEFVQKRLWKESKDETLETLYKALLGSSADIVHIQFHYGLFTNLLSLENLIERLVLKKKVIVTFHKTADDKFGTKILSLKSLVSSLNKCSALVVHQPEDVDRLKSYRIRPELIKLIGHGQIVYPWYPSKIQKQFLGINSQFVIGSYGFLLPHKGIKEVIQATALIKKEIPDVLYMPVCALHPASESYELLKECREEIERSGLKENVKMITDYLSNDESMKYLQACDVVVMPYKPTQESASGAVRFCLAAQKPLVTSSQHIFDEFSNYAVRIKDVNPEEIACGIKEALQAETAKKLVQKAREYIEKTSWHKTAEKFYDLYCSLC